MLAQSCHCAIQFFMEHTELATEWYNKSNYIAVLEIKNEPAIHELLEKASSKQIRFSIFREPDINDEITAIVLEPGDKSRKLCANLPLALKE